MWNAMSFGRAIEHVLTNYANFNGRARRSEFWYFMLFYWLVVLCFAPLTAIPGLALLEMAFMLGMTIPSVAVCWRRLHDTGRSGAWWLLILLPLVGTVMLVIWLTQDSQPGEDIRGGVHAPEHLGEAAQGDFLLLQIGGGHSGGHMSIQDVIIFQCG